MAVGGGVSARHVGESALRLDSPRLEMLAEDEESRPDFTLKSGKGDALSAIDGGPDFETDSFGHLTHVDHVVGEEDEDGFLFRVGLPPASKGAGPTDSSFAAAPRDV
jgi:hypothetical protein